MLKRVPVTNEAQVQDIFPLVAEIWREVFTEMIGQEQVERMLQEYQSPEAILADIAKGVQYFAFRISSRNASAILRILLSEPTILYIVANCTCIKVCGGKDLCEKIFVGMIN